MKRVGSIYNKSIDKYQPKPLQEKDLNTQRTVLKRPTQEHFDFKLQINSTQIKSTSDYGNSSSDREANICHQKNSPSFHDNNIYPFFQQNSQNNSAEELIFYQTGESEFDSLSQYENHQSNQDELVKKLNSLSIIFKQIRQLRKLGCERVVLDSLSEIEDRLLGMEKQMLKDETFF